jgi:hypothetical protein
MVVLGFMDAALQVGNLRQYEILASIFEITT